MFSSCPRPRAGDKMAINGRGSCTCERAPSGHAAVAAPSKVMNSRRLTRPLQSTRMPKYQMSHIIAKTIAASQSTAARLAEKLEKLKSESCGSAAKYARLELPHSVSNKRFPAHRGAGPFYPRELPDAGRADRREALCQKQ